MPDDPQDEPRPRTLRLDRETVQEVTSPLLSSQGHSLWTCDATVVDRPGEATAGPAAERRSGLGSRLGSRLGSGFRPARG